MSLGEIRETLAVASARMSLGRSQEGSWAGELVFSCSFPVGPRDLPSGPGTKTRKRKLFDLFIDFKARIKRWSWFHLPRRPAAQSAQRFLTVVWRRRGSTHTTPHPRAGPYLPPFGRARASLHPPSTVPRVWTSPGRVAASAFPQVTETRPRDLNVFASQSLCKPQTPSPSPDGSWSSRHGASDLME